MLRSRPRLAKRHPRASKRVGASAARCSDHPNRPVLDYPATSLGLWWAIAIRPSAIIALGVVRGDEPDCPGKRNLLAALIGLQRAADRRGNRGARFRALVMQRAACGSECHRGLEGLFDPASTSNVEIEVARLKYN